MQSPFEGQPNLTLAAFTHFGASGLRGVGMYYLVKEAWKRGYLKKVIAVSTKRCQYEFDPHLVETLPGQSRLISGLNQVKNRAWRAFPSRWLGEMVFDFYAASRLVGPGDVLILTPGMTSTGRKAKALGYKTVLYGATSDPRYLMNQIQIERDTFGLRSAQETKNRAWTMARSIAHVANSDYIIALSDFAKQTYINYGVRKERIFVAPLGVNLNRFTSTPPPSDSRLTYLFVAHVNGTTGIIKGLQYLLQTWSDLNLKKARLVVCGKMGAEAQELIRRHKGKLNNVEFTGYVNNIPEYYRQAAVFVFPSLAEGFGKVTLEAMATGRPVIVTPNSGAVARDGIDGFYVPPRDVEALKEKMLYFYRCPKAVTTMGINARKQAENFGWERFSQQIADIVEELSDATVSMN